MLYWIVADSRGQCYNCLRTKGSQVRFLPAAPVFSSKEKRLISVMDKSFFSPENHEEMLVAHNAKHASTQVFCPMQAHEQFSLA